MMGPRGRPARDPARAGPAWASPGVAAAVGARATRSGLPVAAGATAGRRPAAGGLLRPAKQAPQRGAAAAARVSAEAQAVLDKLEGTSLYLVGMMGSGKSTVGKALSEELEYGCLDVDDLLVGATGTSVAEIFADQGEAAFREMESEVLQQVAALTRTVVATGGGAVTSRKNWGVSTCGRRAGRSGGLTSRNSTCGTPSSSTWKARASSWPGASTPTGPRLAR